MYFSLISPADGLLRQAMYALPGTPYHEHQWLWDFFPGAATQSRDFIFRRHMVEQIPRYYVVSQRVPHAVTDAWSVRTQTYDPVLQPGMRLAFQLRANPVITLRDELNKQRRHDVVMHAKKRLLVEQGLAADAKWKHEKPGDDKPGMYDLVHSHCLDWLEQRASRNGFSISNARVDDYQQVRAGERDIRFSTVEFSGELTVVDADQLRKVLFHGLGRAKSFGCGLLIVKRVAGD